MLIRVRLISGLVLFSCVVFSADVLFLALVFESEHQSHKIKNPKRDQRVENLNVLHHRNSCVYMECEETLHMET